LQLTLGGWDELTKTLSTSGVFMFEKSLSRHDRDRVNDRMMEDPRWKDMGFSRKPTEMEMAAFWSALGNLSGKTFGNLRLDFFEMGPRVPVRVVAEKMFRFLQGHISMPADGKEKLAHPFWFVKEMLNSPMFAENSPNEELAAFKDAAFAAAMTISSPKCVHATSEIAQGGVDMRGLDTLAGLPTPEQLDAGAVCSEEFDYPNLNAPPPADLVRAVFAHPYPRIGLAAVKTGLIAVDDMPDGGFAEMVFPEKNGGDDFFVTYTEDEIAAARDKYSEVLDIMFALAPLYKDNATRTEDEVGCSRYTKASSLNDARPAVKAMFSQVTGYEWESQSTD